MAGKSRLATRDYRALSGTPWGLWDTLYRRRSHREFTPGAPAPGFAEKLDELLDLSTCARGAAPKSVFAFTGDEMVDRIGSGCRKGALNKINFWVKRPGPYGFLLMEVPEYDLSRDRPETVPVASLVMEDAVLWLAEQGLGSCWLGAVNGKELSDIVGSPAGSTVPIAVPFGRPVPGATPDLDRSGLPVLARPRKSLTSVAFLESMASPYRPREFSARGFSAPPTQDVKGLLGIIHGDGKTGREAAVPLELVVEACFEAGRVAPSAGNSQPWSFIAVSDEAGMRTLEEACGTTAWEAAVVVVARASSWRSTLAERPFWMVDGPIAISHISLMVASMGMVAEVFVNGFDEKVPAGVVGAGGGNRTVGVIFLGTNTT